jgi:hypothetical protein
VPTIPSLPCRRPLLLRTHAGLRSLHLTLHDADDGAGRMDWLVPGVVRAIKPLTALTELVLAGACKIVPRLLLAAGRGRWVRHESPLAQHRHGSSWRATNLTPHTCTVLLLLLLLLLSLRLACCASPRALLGHREWRLR